MADLLYNGFYCYEMLVVRDLDSVICGLCGVCPEVCLGDGNEKNSCKNEQVRTVILFYVLYYFSNTIFGW